MISFEALTFSSRVSPGLRPAGLAVLDVYSSNLLILAPGVGPSSHRGHQGTTGQSGFAGPWTLQGWSWKISIILGAEQRKHHFWASHENIEESRHNPYLGAQRPKIEPKISAAPRSGGERDQTRGHQPIEGISRKSLEIQHGLASPPTPGLAQKHLMRGSCSIKLSLLLLLLFFFRINVQHHFRRSSLMFKKH